MGVTERVTDIVEPLLADLGIELIDLQFTGGILRVSADKPGGIDMSAIRSATKAISRAMDEHDPVSSKYTLEVSSPGLERPLRTPAHYERAMGTAVRIKLVPRVDGNRRIEGTVTAVSAETVQIALGADGDGDGELVTIAYDDILKARTVFVWEKGEKRGDKSGTIKPKEPPTTKNVAPGDARQAERKAATS